MYGLNDLEERKVKNTIRRVAKVLRFAFNGKSDLYIGTYALLTAQTLFMSWLDNDCLTLQEHKIAKSNMLRILSEFTKTIFKMQFTKKEGK